MGDIHLRAAVAAPERAVLQPNGADLKLVTHPAIYRCACGVVRSTDTTEDEAEVTHAACLVARDYALDKGLTLLAVSLLENYR